MSTITDLFDGAGPASTDVAGTVATTGDEATSSSGFGGIQMYDTGLTTADQRVSCWFDLSNTGDEQVLVACGDGTYSYPWPNGYFIHHNAGNIEIFKNGGTALDTAFVSLGSGVVKFTLEVIGGVIKTYFNDVEETGLTATDGSPLTTKKVGFGWSFITGTARADGGSGTGFYAEDVGGAAGQPTIKRFGGIPFATGRKGQW